MRAFYLLLVFCIGSFRPSQARSLEVRNGPNAGQVYRNLFGRLIPRHPKKKSGGKGVDGGEEGGEEGGEKESPAPPSETNFKSHPDNQCPVPFGHAQGVCRPLP